MGSSPRFAWFSTTRLTRGATSFHPRCFSRWLVGFAVHERVAQAEAAEERGTRAERERDSAARVAVAGERAGIAGELHDVVADAVSVVVLRAGAVRQRMPDEDTDDPGALQCVEEAGRTALAEMRRMLDAMRREGISWSSRRSPAWTRARSSSPTCGPQASTSSLTSRTARHRCTGARPFGVPNHSGTPNQQPHAHTCPTRPRGGPLRRGGSRGPRPQAIVMAYQWICSTADPNAVFAAEGTRHRERRLRRRGRAVPLLSGLLRTVEQSKVEVLNVTTLVLVGDLDDDALGVRHLRQPPHGSPTDRPLRTVHWPRAPGERSSADQEDGLRCRLGDQLAQWRSRREVPPNRRPAS